MKKLFNSRFLFILASSIVVLILLTLGAFYLFDDEDDVFVKSGYVLNPLSSTSEKYFFDENVGYRENLSSMIEFEDVDENTVSVLKDSFVHYLDESMSLLKNGAILDLDSLNGNKVVSFYNITNKSMIEKKDGGYVIDSANGKIELKNFISRISDNKYIVVGDLSLKMTGNATSIKGGYFEVVYVEEGIVNIENKDVKYQVAADNTFIYVGSDKIIDLGNKKITVDEEDVMSITAITIDGDENIEIIPKGNKEEDDDEPSTGGEQGTGENSQGTGQTGNNGTGNSDTEDGEGTGGTGEENVEVEEKPDDVTISLKNAEIGSTDIDVTFEILNAKDDDSFKLQVVNLYTGRTVDMEVIKRVIDNVEVGVSLLTPNTRYLFMVINEKDNGKYFQKVFETKGFGIKLEKTYATYNSLSYKITVEDETEIVGASLTLKKFNEETMELEPVEDKKFLLSELGDLSKGKTVTFGNLQSDTIYTAVLDEFSVASINYKDLYNVSVSSMTLKQPPKFSEMLVEENVEVKTFTLSLSDIDDPNNAITKYTYEIFDNVTGKVMKTEERDTADAVTIDVGKDGIEVKTEYYYRVIIEYFDNEKYVEFVRTDDVIFKMTDIPYLTVVPDKNKIMYNGFDAMVYIRDESCLLTMDGRECNNGVSSTVVEVTEEDPATGALTPVWTRIVEFEGDEILEYPLTVSNLKEGTNYYINVRASYSEGGERRELLHTTDSTRMVSTKTLANFHVDWDDQGSSENHVVNLKAQFLGVEGTGEISADESAASIKKVVFYLYQGEDTNVDRLEITEPLAMASFDSTSYNIKELFYDNGYTISSTDTFGLTIGQLKEKNNGELSKFFTVYAKAYYDLAGENRVKLVNETISYQRSPLLDVEDIESVLEIDEIENNDVNGKFEETGKKLYFEKVASDMIVGYKVIAGFSRTKLEETGLTPDSMNFYVYNKDKKKLKFYVKDGEGEFKLTNKFSVDLKEVESSQIDVEIFMDYGAPYGETDDIMRRGNAFYIGYVIEAKDKEGTVWYYPMAENDSGPSDHGNFDYVSPIEKQYPTLGMYVAKSTANSITYRYTIKDPDNALYKEVNSEKYGFYVSINSGTEKKYDMVQIEFAEWNNFNDKKINQFEGEITIDGLSNGDNYTLVYKMNSQNLGNPDTDIKPYILGLESGYRIFDGYYDLAENADEYNFKYKVINNSSSDNKVSIKILANEELLDRILSYKLSFKDSKGHSYETEKYLLTACDDDGTDRCLTVNYKTLSNALMKSEPNKTNLITVDVTAIYDNGLMGYDFKVGEGDGNDYLYSIMQKNSSELGLGAYVVLTAGSTLNTWHKGLGGDDTPPPAKGYYTWSWSNSLRTQLLYKSQYNTSYRRNFGIGLGATGYSSSQGEITPKMVSIDKMNCLANEDESSCNTFSFNSVTPMLSEKPLSSLINGAVHELKLSGVELSDIKNEGTKDEPAHYLYIDVWDNKVAAENNDFSKAVRTGIKVKIEDGVVSSGKTDKEDDDTITINAVIDGLKEYNESQGIGKYYFNVYAYMYKDQRIKYTQLFDQAASNSANNFGSSTFKEATYELTSAMPSSLFKTYTYSYKSLPLADNDSDITDELLSSLYGDYGSLSELYGKRFLKMKTTLGSYDIDNVGYNFDLVYVLCEADDDNCGPDKEDGDSNIFAKLIKSSEINVEMNNIIDISEYDLEFGKNYFMYIYAKSDYYNSTTKQMEKRSRDVIINQYSASFKLNVLDKPYFEVTRSAVLDNGEYAIDFKINVFDEDRTLIDGNYYIKLLDSNGKLAGKMKLMDNDGNYYENSEYSTHPFDAYVDGTNKTVRISGLKPNSKYSFIVSGDAYLNNYTEDTLPGIDNRTVHVELEPLTTYTTTDYGVAFGDVGLTVTEKTVIVTFRGGSTFDNVTEVHYTVGHWDDESEESTSTINGMFKVGENGKKFEYVQSSGNYRFVINDERMNHTLGESYKITVFLKVKDAATGEEKMLTSNDVPGLEDTVDYYEDTKK